MTSSTLRLAAGGLLVVLVSALAYGARRLPELGAGGLLHPARRPVATAPPASCHNATFTGRGITLVAWRCQPSGVRRGTVVYLHGIADNRVSGTGVIQRFVR